MERLLRQMKSRIEMDQEVIEKFREKLGTDPTYAFEWGDEAMKAAARLRVFRHYVGSIESAAEHDRNEANLHKFVLNDVVSRARHRPSSSSRTSNTMADYTLEAYTELLDMIQL